MIRQGGGSVLSFLGFPWRNRTFLLVETYGSARGNVCFPVGKPSKDKRIFLKSQWRFQISLTERYSGVQW